MALQQDSTEAGAAGERQDVAAVVSMNYLRANVERAFKGMFVPPHRIDQLLEEIRDSLWLAMVQQQAMVETLRQAAEGWGDGHEGYPYVWLLDRAAEAEEGKIPDWTAGS